MSISSLKVEAALPSRVPYGPGLHQHQYPAYQQPIMIPIEQAALPIVMERQMHGEEIVPQQL